MSSQEKWTNASLRAHLGERGFIQEGDTVRFYDKDEFHTSFVRGEDELILVESVNDFTPPHVYQKGREVDVHEIGYRNSQIQHDKLKGD
jgi:hypothetical protein